MSEVIAARLTRRGFLAGTGALVVSFSLLRGLLQAPEGQPGGKPPGKLIQLGELPYDGPTWGFVNRPLEYRWTDVPGGKNGGNYLDADGVRNGANHHAKITITTTTWKTQSGEVVVEVTPLVAKLLDENTGIFIHPLQASAVPKISGRNTIKPPVLTVNTSTGKFELLPVLDCWIAQSDNRTLGHHTTDTSLQPPLFLKFDLSKVTGALHGASLKIHFGWVYVFPTALAIDYVDMPALVTDPVTEIGGVEPRVASDSDIIFKPAWDSEAAIRSSGWSYISPNYPDGKIAMEPQIVDWPKYGMKALRFSSASRTFNPQIGPSILTWRKSTGLRLEAYVRYMIKLDPDVSVGMNEVGVKLPGFEGAGFSARMDHLPYSKVNNAHRFAFNWYGADNPVNSPGRGTFTVGGTLDTGVRKMPNFAFRTGRIYTIEQRIKMNTIRPNIVGKNPYDGTIPIYDTDADGAIEIWVDGVKVFSRTNYVINNTVLTSNVGDFFANFYHGGTATPLSQMHYEFGGVVAATKYIGVASVEVKARSALDEAIAFATLPDWVPAHGTRAVINLNDISNPEKDPAANPNYPNAAPWRGVGGLDAGFGYSQCAIADDLGPLGSMVSTVGGHNGYWGNEVHRFDIATRSHIRMSNPHFPFYSDRMSAMPMHSDANNGELYADASLTTTLQNQPSAFQSYGYLIILPPGHGGTGPLGGLLTPIRVARTPNGGQGGRRSHIFDFETKVWKRFSTNLSPRSGYCYAAYAAPERKVYLFSPNIGQVGWTHQLSVLDCNTKTWGPDLVLSGPDYWGGAGMTPVIPADQYIQAWDYGPAAPEYLLMVCSYGRMPAQAYLISKVTGKYFAPGYTGSVPTHWGGGEWVPELNEYFHYAGAAPGSDVNVVYRLKPQADPHAPWAWSSETITGPAPQQQASGIRHGGRFRWASKIRCFIWRAQANQIQAWRLQGT